MPTPHVPTTAPTDQPGSVLTEIPLIEISEDDRPTHGARAGRLGAGSAISAAPWAQRTWTESRKPDQRFSPQILAETRSASSARPNSISKKLENSTKSAGPISRAVHDRTVPVPAGRVGRTPARRPPSCGGGGSGPLCVLAGTRAGSRRPAPGASFPSKSFHRKGLKTIPWSEDHGLVGQRPYTGPAAGRLGTFLLGVPMRVWVRGRGRALMGAASDGVPLCDPAGTRPGSRPCHGLREALVTDRRPGRPSFPSKSFHRKGLKTIPWFEEPRHRLPSGLKDAVPWSEGSHTMV